MLPACASCTGAKLPAFTVTDPSTMPPMREPSRSSKIPVSRCPLRTSALVIAG
jgi:hypothetical protein